ncbi:unnamed protein product [Musa acuminata var. zebrina]
MDYKLPLMRATKRREEILFAEGHVEEGGFGVEENQEEIWEVPVCEFVFLTVAQANPVVHGEKPSTSRMWAVRKHLLMDYKPPMTRAAKRREEILLVEGRVEGGGGEPGRDLGAPCL